MIKRLLPLGLLCLLALSTVPITATQEPSDYAQLSRLRGSARKDFYLTLTAERKSRLWRHHLALALTKNDFTDEQRNVLATVIDAASADLFRNPERAIPLREQVEAVFNKEQLAALFESPGERLVAHHVTLTPPGCNCSQTMGNWGCSTDCTSPAGTCQIREGCGMLWLFTCDGMCQRGTRQEGEG